MKTAFGCVLAALLCVALPVRAGAQAASVIGGISGRATADGVAVPGVSVSLLNPATGAAQTAATDNDGAFAFAGLATGTYRVRVELDGFAPLVRDDVRVVAGQTAALTFALNAVTFGETVVVTGSRKEELVRYTPAAMSVLSRDDIQAKPVQNYADLLRSVPGVNIVQFSARDVQFTARGAASQSSNKTLALIDGRPAYQPYYGMIIWDLLGVDFDEIKQVEVMRGPGSAMWGTNALTGVVNILTRAPEEDLGTHVRLGGGDLATSDVAIRHAGVRGRLGYKASASFFHQDAWERPTTAPDGTPLPLYDNKNTTRGSGTVRIDFTQTNGAKWRTDAGYASTGGGIVTVVGPQEAKPMRQGFGRVQYEHGATRANVSLDAHDSTVTSLLAPSVVTFSYQTVAAEAEHRFVLPKQVITIAGITRLNHFTINVAPGQHTRQEVGAVADTEIFATSAIRLRAGARIDWFSSFGTTVSPRVGVVIEPVKGQTFRASFNRAYVAPSFLENYLTFATQTIVPLPTGPFPLPFLTQGNHDLNPLTDRAAEVGYTGALGSRATVTLSAYRNVTKGIITLVPTTLYSPTDPPPGWPLPASLLSAMPLPKVLTEMNLGTVIDAGLEASIDARLAPSVSTYANYSFQRTPDVSQDVPITLNTPARHRVNAGISASHDRYFGSLSLSASSRAFWADVQPFTGWTNTFAMVNGTAGVRFRMRRGDGSLALKVVNIGDAAIRQHIFGDVLRRRISVELHLNF